MTIRDMLLIKYPHTKFHQAVIALKEKSDAQTHE